MQTNYLNVTGTDYLVVDSYEEEVPITEVDGKPNVIDLLYTQDGIEQYPTYPSNNGSAYNIVQTTTPIYVVTNTMRLLVSSGLEAWYSASVGDNLFMNWDMRAQVRAYITKFPFNIFSGFSAIKNSPTYLTSYDDFMIMCESNIWIRDETTRERWNEFAKNYEWTDDIPKGIL